MELTALPRTPSWFKGVLLLRGRERKKGIWNGGRGKQSKGGNEIRNTPSSVSAYARDFVYCVFAVFVTTIEDTCHTAEEQSSGGAQSALESLTENAAVTEHDAEGVVNVAWTAVDKRRLVELINQLSTGGDAKAQSNPAADIHEHRPGHLMHIHCHSASERSCHENSLIQSERDHHSPLVPQQDTSLESVSCTYLDLGKYEEANISSCPKVPKQSDHTDASRMPPCRKTNKQVSGLSGNPEKPPQKVAQASFEVWTSVDKTLVEDLFDQMLRSFDEIKVRRPEADETGCGGSRGWSSVSRLSSTDDVTYGLVDGRQWHSAAYKWKSQILQRMRSQPVTKHAPLRRKRPYAELKLVPNSAF